MSKKRKVVGPSALFVAIRGNAQKIHLSYLDKCAFSFSEGLKKNVVGMGWYSKTFACFYIYFYFKDKNKDKGLASCFALGQVVLYKLKFAIVKEQRVYGSYNKSLAGSDGGLLLRCTLKGFEKNYQLKIL